MLEVRDIRKAFGSHQVLRSVSFEAEPGECVGIIGSNGCGKTTLLSVLAGAAAADHGEVCYGGLTATGHPAVFARSAAYVPQENPLIEELTVRDNLLLWYRGDRRAMEEDIRCGAAAMLGVGEMLKKPVSRLSGGMKKRVSIACALSNHAETLILDEPGAALDLECKAAIRDYLRTYRSRGGTVILTSHEMTELSVCTRLYLLKGGKLHPLAAGLTEDQMISYF